MPGDVLITGVDGERVVLARHDLGVGLETLGYEQPAALWFPRRVTGAQSTPSGLELGGPTGARRTCPVVS
jgi:hypothetical protein